jgi:hypothetical protein
MVRALVNSILKTNILVIYNIYYIILTAQQTKIGELLSGNNEYTSVRVSKITLNELAKRGKFGETFENIIQRMIENSDDKLQPTEGSF